MRANRGIRDRAKVPLTSVGQIERVRVCERSAERLEVRV
jgi:hypothetical protein